MSHSSPHAKSRVFYGWFVVAGAFAVTFVGFGCAYTFSVFLEPMQTTFHASLGSVSLVFSVAGFLYFALGIVSGPLADRWGSRQLAIVGMIMMSLGLVIAGVAPNLSTVYAAYGLGIGLGVGCSYVPSIGAVQRWFLRQRGLATGLAVSGISVGTLVMPPLASFLIETVGWRNAYVFLGILAAVIGIGMALLIENDPSDRGLGPDGAIPHHPAHTRHVGGVSIRDAVTSWRFVGLYLACLIGSFGLFIPFVHLVPYAQDHGVPSSSAVFLLSLIGIGSTVGRFLLGGLADRMDRRTAVLVMFIGMAFSQVLWIFSNDFWPLAAFALIFGTFYGGFVALLPSIVMDDFGGRNVSGIIGILYTSVAFGTLVGPSAAGYAFDITHSYTLPILASVCTNVIAACIVAGTGRVPIQLHKAGGARGD